MLRGSYLAAGDRFTVRVGGVVVGIGKVAVQDAWSRGGPRQEGRNTGHKRPILPTTSRRSVYRSIDPRVYPPIDWTC